MILLSNEIDGALSGAYGAYGVGRYYGFYFDWTYLLVIVAALFSILASVKVNSTFRKYAKVRSMSGMTGAQTAQQMLNYAGIQDVRIERVSGHLTDHYDPRNKVLRLSDSTFSDCSVAAVGVAAHECGHAIQHDQGYGPLALRSTLIPIANFGSKIGIPIILIGALMSYNSLLIQIGILVFSISVAVQIITLPVEINASRRAVKLLGDYGILAHQELPYCRRVLTAAAMTYVAAAASAVMSLIRLILIFGNRRRD